MNVETRIQQLSHWEIIFKQQGWEGNELVDLLEVIDDLNRFGVELSEAGEAILYHATSEEKAQQILQDQAMFGLEDGLFFSTSPNGQIEGYGSTVLKVWVAIPLLELNDVFKAEQHYRVPVRPRQPYPFRIERY